ncbi:hypothetical protein COLO4_12925 [Corchorus olitorius]|uniref:Pentatricopeptide repeat-containing protein n=1 Tax=Corchorus olitorius TaxID=93759 RepID=A0A1R3JZ16_9ROSI|nr:hypothetical protein COLO4_12925 [Corchorus olitorius]
MLSLRPVRRLCHAASAASAIASKAGNSEAVSRELPNTKRIQETALSKLKAERDPEKLFLLFKENAHNKLVIENRFAFEDTVSRLAGAGRFDYIEHLLEHQKSLPQGRREGFIVRIIMLYGKAGMIKHSVDTFYDMHLYGCNRTVKSFNATLKVLIQTRDLSAIESFIADCPEKFSVELDTYTINILVKGFCELDLLDRAYLIMVEIEKLGIRPDVVTYTTLMSAFYQKNRFEIGNGLWNLMVYKGCKPNLATFNVRIQYLVHRGWAWRAFHSMRLMQKIGIVPDEVTYNLVIKGLCQTGYLEMAKGVYSSLRARSVDKPNVKIYQTMVHYLCKGGEYDMAYTMCKECMRQNRFLNICTIHSLLKGLMGTGQVDKARMMMKLVRSRVPRFSSTQLKYLQSALSRLDEDDGSRRD